MSMLLLIIRLRHAIGAKDLPETASCLAILSIEIAKWPFCNQLVKFQQSALCTKCVHTFVYIRHDVQQIVAC